MYQFTASAISNRMKKLEAYFSSIGPQDVTKIRLKGKTAADVHLLKAEEGSDMNNPFGGLNIGIITVKNEVDHSTVNLKLIGYDGSQQWRPVTMFGSGEL